MIPPCVMWCDPGLMTGLSWLWDRGTQFRTGEWDFDEAADRIERTCASLGPALAVGWETYHVRPDLPQTGAHYAIEMIGVCRRYARKHRCQVLPPAEPHSPDATDQLVLRALGWWTAGCDDAQSAAGHMLRYLMRSGSLPPAVSAALSEHVRTL